MLNLFKKNIKLILSIFAAVIWTKVGFEDERLIYLAQLHNIYRSMSPLIRAEP